MKKYYNYLTVTLLLFTGLLKGLSQNNYIDSLRKVVITRNTVAEKIQSLLVLQDAANDNHNPKEAIEAGVQALELARKSGNFGLESKVMLNTGIMYLQQNNFKEAFHYYFDNLNASIRNHSDTDEVKTYWYLSTGYLSYRPDSSVYYSQKGYLLSKRVQYRKGEEIMLLEVANAYTQIDNYAKALKYSIDYLKFIEKGEDQGKIITALITISNINQQYGDHQKALEYLKKAETLAKDHHNNSALKDIELNFSDIYEKMDSLKEAMKYGKHSLKNALENQDDAFIGMSSNNLGNIYFKLKQIGDAEYYYKQAIPYLIKSMKFSFLCESYLELSKIFQIRQSLDSAIYYAKAAAEISRNSDLNQSLLWSNQQLSSYYEQRKMIDSAFYFQNRLMELKDSLFNTEKIRQVQLMNMEEDIRQKELAESARIEKEERLHKLQMLTIGLLIPLFFLMSLFLSKKRIHVKVVEFAGIVSVLLFFEYITLLMHPAVSELTNHSPFLEIVIFVVVAAFITPAHHKIQHWMLQHLANHHKSEQLHITTKKIREKRTDLNDKN